MNGLRSPDIPAYLSYALVLIVGSVVAVTSVNKLLAEQRDRWAYPATWQLFAGYTLLPVGLFWFLDYNNVISDTSLFSAIVTAVAYQQIFAGGVEGIRLPGQTGAVWRVFEAWTNLVQQRIDRLNQARNARFTERTLTFIAAQDSRVDRLRQLVLARSIARATLEQDLTNIDTQSAGLSKEAVHRQVVKRLWDDLRLSERDNWGQLLADLHLIGRWTYWVNFRSGRSILMSVSMALIVVVAGLAGYRASKENQGDIWVTYQQWRFVRPSPTAADEFRSRKELLIALKSNVTGAGLAVSLTDELLRRDVLPDTAQRILDFLLFAHSPSVTPRIVPPLIQALRTPNPDVRLRIHRTLKDVQKIEFEKAPLAGAFDGLDKWVPAKEDSAGAIDGYIQAWLRWWATATSPGGDQRP